MDQTAAESKKSKQRERAEKSWRTCCRAEGATNPQLACWGREDEFCHHRSSTGRWEPRKGTGNHCGKVRELPFSYRKKSSFPSVSQQLHSCHLHHILWTRTASPQGLGGRTAPQPCTRTGKLLVPCSLPLGLCITNQLQTGFNKSCAIHHGNGTWNLFNK